MEDTWLSIEDDSSYSASDSDIIDSETEADLYSTIHHEENISSYISKSVNCENDVVHSISPAVFVSSQNTIICKQEKRRNNLEENQISPNKKMRFDKFKQDSNPTKKTKTDYESKPSPKKRNSATKVDFSDSDDSIIWTDLDSSGKSDFTTNLSREDVDTIYLSSSDSDSELPSVSSPTFIKRESILRNLSMPNIKIGEKHEGQWYVNNEDLYRSRKYSRRYHNNIELMCTNCNEKGHNFKSCPQPKAIKCFICGGRHLGSRCANRICGNCFQYGHERRRCRLGPTYFFCELCSRHGHLIQNCPDLWRRYHLTTEPVKIIPGKQVKQDSSIYCWNCGENGHFGGVCGGGFSRNNVKTWPCVISYDDPKEMFRRRLEDLRIEQNNFRWNEHLQHRENFNEIQELRNKYKLMPRRLKNQLKRWRRKRNIKMAKREENVCNTQPETSNEKVPNRKYKRAERAIQRCTKSINSSKRKIKALVGEKDFPRSPKQIVPKPSDEIPKSLEIEIRRKLKKERLKLKKQLKRQQRLTALQNTPSQVE